MPIAEAGEIRIEDYEQAIHLLINLGAKYPFTMGRPWLDRAIHHLHRKAGLYFRERAPLDSEQAVVGLIKGTASELRDAGQALLQAAKAFKDMGKGTLASDTHAAAKRAMAAAKDLADA